MVATGRTTSSRAELTSAAGAGVLCRPWQTGRRLRDGRLPGLVCRIPVAEHRRWGRRRARRRRRCPCFPGYEVSASNIVLSTTHAHAAPTLMGLWGHTYPGYLHRAQGSGCPRRRRGRSNTRTKRNFGRPRARSRAWSPSFRGPIRRLGSRSTIKCRFCGRASPAPARRSPRPPTCRSSPTIRSDPVRQQPVECRLPRLRPDRLQQLLGGTAASRGRHPRPAGAIGSDPHYAEVEEQGRFVTNAIFSALAQARPITDTTLAADNVPFTTEATNMGLLAAIRATSPVGHSVVPARSASPEQPPPRHLELGRSSAGSSRSTALWKRRMSTSAPGATVGSSATVARIGDQVYTTVPGEDLRRSPKQSSAPSPARPASRPRTSSTRAATRSATSATMPRIRRDSWRAICLINNVGPNVGQDAGNAPREGRRKLGLGPSPRQVTRGRHQPEGVVRARVQFYPDQSRPQNRR